MVKPGIFGTLHKNCLVKVAPDRSLIVYKEVNVIVFETDNESNKFEILINKKPLKLSDMDYSPEYIMGWKDIADIILERPTLDEESLLKDYHLLNEQGKQHARDYIAYLVTKEEFKEETNA